ncbi:MAG: ABC transporter permease [Erysipelotrichales bacterium]|nr:ABC transporter permease [Erysipelotrichales bacterium]
MKFRFQRKYLSIPYILFFILFIIVPLFLILFYAFTDKATGHISLSNLVKFVSDSTNLNVLAISLTYAVINTILCLLISYPIAYFLADRKINKSAVLVTLFIMPMWINFVIRTGATRDVLSWLGLSGGSYPEVATVIGLVYNYIPFTILPLYTTMLKMDRNQIEASRDLGANGFQTFVKVIIPMTMPGIVSAATMVFMPTLSSYVISDILSEYNVVLFGSYIDLYFNQSDWNFGSFMAFIMLLLIFISVFITRKFSKDDEGKESIW